MSGAMLADVQTHMELARAANTSRLQYMFPDAHAPTRRARLRNEQITNSKTNLL